MNLHTVCAETTICDLGWVHQNIIQPLAATYFSIEFQHYTFRITEVNILKKLHKY